MWCRSPEATPMTVQFTVYGIPIPQGSTKAFIPKGWNRAIITSDNKKTKPWRQEIAGTARDAMQGLSPAGRAIPISVRCCFYFDKPKSVKKSVNGKTTKPDVDKLARAVLDALTGITFDDDSQVTELYVMKRFGSPARAVIAVSEVTIPPSQPLLREESLDTLPI
jgi:crossover junction endodeoxyribonuclease RusA